MTATLPKATTEAVGIEQRTDTLLQRLDAIANQIHQRWDTDQRSGKLLVALRGKVENYNPDITAIRHALAVHDELVRALEVARDELSNRIDQRLDRADLDDLSQIRAIVDLYFEDWGSTKADRWKALTGEPLGGGEAAMRIIQRILR